MKDLTIDEIHDLFKGKGGDDESETILNDTNFDKKNGSVFVYSNKSDAAKIIKRCKKGIKSFKISNFTK